MTTFFISYTTGEYDSFYEHAYTFDAESKEALLAEVERAVNAFKEYETKRREARKAIDEYRGSRSSEEYLAKWQEFRTNYPRVDNLHVFGHWIALFDNVMSEEVEEVLYRAGFQIHTIDEYIEICRPEAPLWAD